MATAIVAAFKAGLKPVCGGIEPAASACTPGGELLNDRERNFPSTFVKMQVTRSVVDGRWRTFCKHKSHGRKDSSDSLTWRNSFVSVSLPVRYRSFRVVKFEFETRAKSDDSKFAKKLSKINLNEYMVMLDKPIGIRFAQTLSGKVYVEALAKNGNADKSRIVMVGDVLKKTSAESGDQLWDVSDLGRTMMAIKSRAGPVSLVLERSSQVSRSTFTHSEAPVGQVASSTWNNSNPSVQPHGGDSGYGDEETYKVIRSFSDEDISHGDIEWTHGSYNEEEYLSALERSEADLIYNPSQGIKYTKITEQIVVGSCIHTDKDRRLLMDRVGITAVLNLQRKSEQANWGIDGDGIERAAKEDGLLMVNCPIRDVDSVDLRRKLPYAVGILYRLLRQGRRVYVTCTTGVDRAPACVIAYLHWIQDVALQEAVAYIKRLHPCGPDMPALVWATWDLIAMAEQGEHKGPPTHAVQFVWNHGSRDGEEVLLVGDFKGGWDQPTKTVHVSGPKYTVDLRLPQGKYNYKFIVGGHWRHSNNLPTEGDQWGNINNVIKIGDVASFNFDVPQRGNIKDLNTIKVIERPLTEDERFTLAFAARRMAAGIDPFTFAPKKKQ